ncbi:MAG: MBL fold metallo-hydrolase [Thiohalocapsa sp.]|jgi:phosphoribosyl 1,2-cyclic phosphodiesterase|uniref:MBL fold metallo-hydrolase n=1 Tax=Thiohalocapsa sp. TaxID=2497641 RepID=UPI0025D7C59C|nr:MBL fold metallo-hydrolase [Thiohalocapsa sp.]MCG6940216.1 MBL fold metallo-hydrolase [Thiohalocapsa sp.]
MRFAVLGSGSRGNATLIECDGTRVLLDCGFPLREVERRLAEIDAHPRDLSAIVVTHEHGDHVSGVARLAQRHGLTVWASPGTWNALCRGSARHAYWPELPRPRLFPSHAPGLCIGALTLRPIPVPHDAREPCQFVFEGDGRRLGVLTDAGTVTPRMCDALRECDALMLETNHDPDMLRRGPYPPSVQRRVGGAFGHLSNTQAAELLDRVHHAGLRQVLLSHLSRQNNRPELALAAVRSVVSDLDVAVADQERGSGWRPV